ncbi:Spermatogenesis associated-like protein, partial [Operophtera brumata]
MPKLIELTIEIEIQMVSCPGVWLCQDGRVSLSVYALGTNYQTCLLPPVFPLLFKDIFYFRKRFQEMCAVNNICCLLMERELQIRAVFHPSTVPRCTGRCAVPSEHGILSPKIEIATKVRIDEIWNQPCHFQHKTSPCSCAEPEGARQRPVCHSRQFH